MTTATRMTYFKAKVEDKPGGLLALATQLKDQNIDLVGVKGVSHAGHGDVLIIPKNPDKTRGAWNASGILLEEGTLFFLSGVNNVGALTPTLDALAKANVNIVALEAGAVGTKFGAFVWVSPGDVEKAAKALSAAQ
jgi:hypothetical protein